MTPTKAKMILNKIAHCRTDNCPPDECAECDYGVTEYDCNEALETAIEALKSFQTQMSGTSANNSEIPNSSELISRQAALDIVDDLNSPDWYMEWGAEARKRLVDLPAIKPEQKTGHWILYTKYLECTIGCKCSECGTEACDPDWDFCPYCGVKMEDKAIWRRVNHA